VSQNKTPTQSYCDNFNKYGHNSFTAAFRHELRKKYYVSATSPQICCCITLRNLNVHLYNVIFELNDYPAILTDRTIHTCHSSRDNKKAQLSLTNPRDACEKFARFT